MILYGFCQETEELKHDHVSRNFALALQKARNDKGLTQKDFATKVTCSLLGSSREGDDVLQDVGPLLLRLQSFLVFVRGCCSFPKVTKLTLSCPSRIQINEKPQVVNEYEQGKAIPNQQIIGKMERTLGVKLRGKGKKLGSNTPGAYGDIFFSWFLQW